jgi:hypothetical protein
MLGTVPYKVLKAMNNKLIEAITLKELQATLQHCHAVKLQAKMAYPHSFIIKFKCDCSHFS